MTGTGSSVRNLFKGVGEKGFPKGLWASESFIRLALYNLTLSDANQTKPN